VAFSVADHVEVGFADGGTANGSTGHDVTLPGGGNASAGDYDVLIVGSDTTVTTPTAFDVYQTFVGNQGGYLYIRRCTAGVIVPDTTGSTAITTAATSAVVDITAAAVGATVYAWVDLGVNTAAAVTATGWTSVLNAIEGTSARYALMRRRKTVGDTTFTFNWTTSTKGVIGWSSYRGVDATTPDENATLATNGSTSRTAVPTSSVSPTSTGRWALTCYGVRTTTVGNKPITWTPDAALVERLDVDNNAAGSSPWCGIQIADSNGTVTNAAHSYTATHNAAESHDGSAIIYLIPQAVEGPTVRVKTNGDNSTVAFLTRLRGAALVDTSANAHVDSAGAQTNPTVSSGTLASATDAIVVASTNTDMQAGTPTGPSWSGSYTALGTATVSSGVTGAWGASAWKTPVGTTAESPAVTWTNGMRNRYVFLATFTQAAGGGITINDDSGGAPGGSSAETLLSDIVKQDSSSGASGGSSAEQVQSGVTLQDSSSGASAGSSTEQVLVGVTLQDSSSGASGGGSTEQVTVGVNIQDGSGGAAAGSSREALVIDRTIQDSSGGASGGGSVDTPSNAIILQDASGGASGGGTQDTVNSSVVLQDTSGGAAGGSSAETLLISTVIQDSSGGAAAGSSRETVSAGGGAVDVTINDFSGGASAGSSAQTVQTSAGVVQDTMVMPVLANALTCLQTEVNKVPDPPAEYMIRPGATFTAMADSRYDECCNGIGWVRPGPFWESDSFPEQRSGVSHVQPAYYAVSVELGVMRCLPTKSNVPANGPDAKPTAAQWLEATQAEQDDGAALRRAVCCLRELYQVDGVVAGQYNPLENEANCTGISVVVTMRVPACDCIDAP
jgi:hypothetical protein